MSKVVKFEASGIDSNKPEDYAIQNEQSLMNRASDMLTDVRADVIKKQSVNVPIAQLSTLGAGVSSLLPALRTVTQTTTISADSLYRVVNAADGVLKANKSGEFFWGALKTPEGTSKMAKLMPAGPISATTEAVAAINPAIMMMAVALFSVEQKLGEVAETQKQILSFLEKDREADVEASLETLGKIATEYKYNWDNERYIASNHKMVLDIKYNSRKNMISYQKAISEVISTKKLIVAQNKVESAKENLITKFKYYRLSLFAFSMSSMLEVLLNGKFNEDYIAERITDLEALSMSYRELFEKCSSYLEELGKSSIEAKVLKGSGKVVDSTGKLIEKIPVIERGHIDELLRERGSRIQKSGEDIEFEAVSQFAAISNPGIRMFIEQLSDIIKISNTSEIYIDDKNIYLMAE